MDHGARDRILTYVNLARVRTDNDKRREPRVVDLAGQRVGLEAARHLAALLQTQGVNQLILDDNDLGPLGLTQVSLGVANSDALHDLRLARAALTGGNPMRVDPQGLGALGEALSRAGRLVHLDLSGNFLGAEGLRVLLPVLSVHPGLQSLNLANTLAGELGDSDVLPKFVRSLATMPALTALDLSQSHVSRSAALALQSVLARHSTLTDLRLRDANMRLRNSMLLLEALGANAVLAFLDLRGTVEHLRPEQAVTLRETLWALHHRGTALQRMRFGFLSGPHLATADEMRGKATVRVGAGNDAIFCEDLGLQPADFPPWVEMVWEAPALW